MGEGEELGAPMGGDPGPAGDSGEFAAAVCSRFIVTKRIRHSLRVAHAVGVRLKAVRDMLFGVSPSAVIEINEMS